MKQFLRNNLPVLALAAVNSTGIISPQVQATLQQASTICITVAIAALGIKTSIPGMLSIGFSISSLIGPLLVGPIIDFLGFRAAFLALLVLPLATLWWLSRVRFEERPRIAGASKETPQDRSVFDLLRDPALRKVMLVQLVLE